MMDTLQLSSLDHYFAEYITRLEGVRQDGLWVAAALVSAVSCRGDVCLDLAAATEYSIVPFQTNSPRIRVPACEEWKSLLSECAVIGTPGEYSPLILDESGRLYLHKSWNFEHSVAEEILMRSASPIQSGPHDEKVLDRYFPTNSGEVDMQKEAARSALSRKFTVIAGGPGTGKTSTVARFLAVLIELSHESVQKILLAAPTGKAAMRLKQSIVQSMKRLELSDELRSQITAEVFTLHRLLGVIPGKVDFRHNRLNPLKCDVLVIDEASMIDLPLMARLLDAVPKDARIIMLGDRDQLSSVEAGAVLADICSGSRPDSPPETVRPAIVSLTKSYRFGDLSGIGQLSRLVNAGDGLGGLALLESGRYADLRWHHLSSYSVFPEMFKAAVRQGFDGLSAATDPSAALEALERFRVLTPHRDGRFGVVALNRLAETAVQNDERDKAVKAHFRPIMVTGNNYDLGLYNGDTGVLCRSVGNDVEREEAYFAGNDEQPRRISALRLPPHEPAYAMTVHKSQGSEFDHVLVILPDQLSAVLCRELLYTAITRARTTLEIWGVEEVFCQAVERRIVRRSGLTERLWGQEQL